MLQSRVRPSSPDRSSYSAASHCGPIRLANWSRSKAAPGRQVRFGSLNFTADIRGDLILDGFEPQPSVPYCHDGHDLALQLDSTLEAALGPAPIFDPELAAQTEDGWLDTASGAATSTAIEPNTDLVPPKARDSEVSDSEPPAPLQMNPIGRRSWSSPRRTPFNTHLLATS